MEDVADGPIGVAVSGGSDSVALLVLAADWAAQHGRTVAAVTVDHGLRNEAADEAEGVASLCGSLGVDHTILRWDGQHSGNTQDAARRARHNLIGAWAKERRLVAVATGHTRDDQAETFLLRLKRGSGVDGLSGMAPAVVKDGVLWLRPLLRERRDVLREMLMGRGLRWVDDPSNEDDRFDRVKMRKVLALLAETGIDVDVLADTTDRLRTARTALEQMTFNAAQAVVVPRDIGSVRWSVHEAGKHSEEVQLRLLAHCLRWVAHREYRPRLAALKLALAAVTQGRAHSLSGCLMSEARQGIVEISREASAIPPSDAASQSFDHRWDCETAVGEWRPLGEAGLAKFPHWRDTAEHRNALLSSPSLWYINELKSAPFVDTHGSCKCWLREGPESFYSSILSH